jgi:hypothetical protein
VQKKEWQVYVFAVILFTLIVMYVITGSIRTENVEREQSIKQKNNTISLPSKNSVELDKIWEFKGIGIMHLHATDEKNLYIQSGYGTYYVIDDNSLNVVKKIEIPYGDDESFYNLTASNGILATTSDDKVVVFDTNKDELLLDYKIKKSWDNIRLDWGVLLYDDLVIFSYGHDEATYGLNYNTEQLAWKSERGWKTGPIDLYRYKDRYLYRHTFSDAFYEFDPKSGAIIGKYPYEFVALNNRDSHKHTDSFYIVKNVKDRELREWLEGFYMKTGKGDVYSVFKSRLHFHGQNLNPLWELEFSNEIEDEYNYGKYMFLNFKDSIVLLELKNDGGEILWTMKTKDNLIHRIFIHKERLYVSYKDNTIEAFDLSKLDQ